MKKLLSAVTAITLSAGFTFLLVGPASASCHMAHFIPPSYSVKEDAGKVVLTVVQQGGPGPTCSPGTGKAGAPLRTDN